VTAPAATAAPPVPYLDPRARHRIRLLWITAAVCVVAFVALYVVFVLTVWGQTIDGRAYGARWASPIRLGERREHILRTIVTPASLVVFTLAYTGASLLRRRWRLALGVCVAIGGSVVTAEILKEVLPRPIHPGIGGFPYGSLPSGHATIGMSLALGLVMVAPQRWRWVFAVAATLIAALFGTGVVLIGWHRPSDVLTAYCVSLAWFAVCSGVLVRWRGRGDPAHFHHGAIDDRATPGAEFAVSAIILGGLLAALALSLEAQDLAAVPYSRLYVGSLIVIDALGIAVVGWYFGVLHSVALDPPLEPLDPPDA
jgi:membrane-associated phospholipid phosphatase